ncbi:hypothetical protein ACFE04_004390 [Oxalis oulophora]
MRRPATSVQFEQVGSLLGGFDSSPEDGENVVSSSPTGMIVEKEVMALSSPNEVKRVLLLCLRSYSRLRLPRFEVTPIADEARASPILETFAFVCLSWKYGEDNAKVELDDDPEDEDMDAEDKVRSACGLKIENQLQCVPSRGGEVGLIPGRPQRLVFVEFGEDELQVRDLDEQLVVLEVEGLMQVTLRQVQDRSISTNIENKDIDGLVSVTESVAFVALHRATKRDEALGKATNELESLKK